MADEDGRAILKRRKELVALALASLTMTACEVGTSTPDAGPVPCLSDRCAW